MFDVGPFEILVILVASLFIFGPDRLPKAAAQAAKIIRELRGMASGARADLGDALGPDLADLTMNLRDLDPRAAITRALMDDDTGRRREQAGGHRVHAHRAAAVRAGDRVAASRRGRPDAAVRRRRDLAPDVR